jgi:Flp pilus assembly protein TadG
MKRVNFARKLRQDERGVALVEFAIVLPVLLLLYLGGYQLNDALACNRKVTIAARAVADLTTQNATLTTSQINTILNASSTVLAPYAVSNALVRVTELTTDANGKTTVTWSMDNRGGGLAANSPYILPANVKIKSSSIILSEVSYSYNPIVTFNVFQPITLSDKIFMYPRVSNSVDKAS